MSQSESEADFAPTDDKPLFPYERLYYDAADKALIHSKNQLEKEAMITEREDELMRHEQDTALVRLLAAREKEQARAAAKNKRKASAAELDEGHRKSSRQRTKLGGGRAGEASTTIEAYKKQREERKLQGEQRKKAPTRRLSPQDYSDDDGEADSEDDYDYRRSKRRSPTPIKDDPQSELADVQKARIGRDNFAQVCYTPGFESAATGCFARVCLGPGRTPGVNEYRLCSIKGIQKGKPYAMTGENGRPFLTDQYVLAAHGKAEKPWSFLECSMSRFTEDEWRRYRVTMANEDCKMPTQGFINRKLDELNRLITYKWDNKAIGARVRTQKELVDMVNKTKEKEDLMEKISDARDLGDSDLVADYEEKLANIVPMKLALGTSLGPKNQATQVKVEEDRLAVLNRRNQKLNAENIRKAQLAEMHARKAKKHLAPGVDELFEGGSDISRSGTPVNGHGTPKIGAAISRSGTPVPMYQLTGTPKNGTPRAGTPVPSLLKPGGEKRKGIPVIRKAVQDDEILATMDLGIEVDF